MRVLELHPGLFHEELVGTLHHCRVEEPDKDRIEYPLNFSARGKVDYALNYTTRSFAVSKSTGKTIHHTAISYTWGGNRLSHTIRSAGCLFKITQTLDAALRHFRHQKASVLLICYGSTNSA